MAFQYICDNPLQSVEAREQKHLEEAVRAKLLKFKGKSGFEQAVTLTASSIEKRYVMEYCVVRLEPGDDLLVSLKQVIVANNIEAACILSCVGSLDHASLRLANQSGKSFFPGKFEIVSLSGTLSVHGSHLHISIADSDGKVTGGHLLAECQIYTTGEIVLGLMPDLIFLREPCPLSGYSELKVIARD